MAATKFRGTTPGIAFSQHEFEGTPKEYIEFLKELRELLPEIPDEFGTNPNDLSDVKNRLERANKYIVKVQKELPESKNYLPNK